MPLLKIPGSELSRARPSTHKKRPLSRFAADQVFERVLAVTPERLDQIVAVIGARIGLDPSALPLIVALDDEDNDNDENQEFELRDGGIAVVAVHGTLVKRAGRLNARSGLSSYEGLHNQIESAVSDPEVRGILLECDSPGGDADGMLPLCDFIYGLRGAKPIYAIADNQAASAAFAIASAADQIYTTRTGMLGSVGCLAIHLDRSVSDQQRGLKYTLITSGARKADASSHMPLSAAAKSDIQGEVDRIAAMFRAAVARNRSVGVQSITATEAGVAYGERALGLFADRLGECEDACAAMRAALPAPPVYILPPSTPAALPPARQRLLAAPASWQSSEDDAMAWLSSRSNLQTSASLLGVAARLRAEHSSMTAKYGPNVEARVVALPGARAAAQSASGSRRVEMLVAPWNSLSIDLGGFFERYEPHCFDLSYDVRALWNHDESAVLGRKSAGTCQVFDAPNGIRCVIAEMPDTTDANNVLELLRLGNVTGASASFWILVSDWVVENGRRIRRVQKALLRDVSVCSIPAYEQSTASIAPAAATDLDRARARLEAARASSRPMTFDEARR